jgi:hypothetical protein
MNFLSCFGVGNLLLNLSKHLRYALNVPIPAYVLHSIILPYQNS